MERLTGDVRGLVGTQKQHGCCDVNGFAEFILPSRSFKFRVDGAADQKWSGEVAITAGQETTVEISLE